MCQPALRAAIHHYPDIPERRYRESILSSYFDALSIDSTVAIPCPSLEDPGHFDEKNKKDKKHEVRNGGSDKKNLKNSGEEEK